MNRLSLAALRQELQQGPWSGEIRVQVETLQTKEANNGKPFRELKLRDGTDSLTLRAWNDTAVFAQTADLTAGATLAVSGEFYHNGSFGPDARRWQIRVLTPEETAELFVGSAEEQAAAEAAWQALLALLATLRDPRLRALTERFLGQHGARFCRAAAARSFHHARRGGLLAHTLQMLRCGDALCTVYPELNRDLLLAGILFHDCGKLWETCPPEQGFDIPHQVTGEMLGHITIGIELINRLWADLAEERQAWRGLEPESEQVRLHLLHLIASHHGELAFGSPVEPKIPEAFALHYIDNLDAKLEMVRNNYATGTQLTEGIYDRARPLTQRLIRPLPPYTEPPSTASVAPPSVDHSVENPPA